MQPESVDSASARPRREKLPWHQRARAVPGKRPFILAVLASACFYLALVGTTAALFALMVNPGRNSAALLIGFAGFSALLWMISFLMRRRCPCPLCLGTPFVDSSSVRHRKAVRIFPLTYGTSNVIRALVRQHFRCQCCGTPFDLLKPLTLPAVEAPVPPAGLTQMGPESFYSLPPVTRLWPPAA
jgi:hypothetical protein